MLYKKSCYILIIILCFCTILFTGCDKDKSFILFTSGEITPENFSMDRCKKAFKIGERIDFLLYNPKPLKHNVIRLQVLKVNFVEPSFNYSIAYGRDINIDISLNYATDHFYLYDRGYYMLRIYSPEDYDMPVAESGFTVE
jgi:hypothetical protein